MNKNHLGIRLVLYFSGLFIMTLGVIISTKSNLGVTPISSIPYAVSLASGMNFGVSTALLSVLMVLAQIVILKKQFKPINLFQFPVGILFGSFISFCQSLMNGISVPDSLIIRFIFMLFSTFVVAIGVFLYISVHLIPLAPDGLMLVVAQVTKKSFPSIKTVFDVTMVCISLVLCIITIGNTGSVGVGTIITAIFVGNEVKILNKLLGPSLTKLLK